MTYQEFVNNIFYIFNKILDPINKILSFLMSNHIFKTIVYIVIIALIIEFIGLLINFIKNLYKPKKENKNNCE